MATVATQNAPFITHLDRVLSACERGPPNTPLPQYAGPSTAQTENILRIMSAFVRRMYTAEHELAAYRAAQKWGGSGPETKKRRSVRALTALNPRVLLASSYTDYLEDGSTISGR